MLILGGSGMGYQLYSSTLHLVLGEIDWGGIDVAGDEGGIDFSIDTVELDASGIVLEEDGIEGGVARNEEALSIFDNIATRRQFVYDLCEVCHISQGLAAYKDPHFKVVSSTQIL
jgi:hypothetical protein